MPEPGRREKTAQSETQANEPNVIDLDRVETESGFDSINEDSVKFNNLTEATLRYEAPQAREARELREADDQRHKQRVELIKIGLACVLLLGFFALGCYLFAIKPGATEAQKTYATVILTAIASGSAGYAFGKQEKKSDKD